MWIFRISPQLPLIFEFSLEMPYKCIAYIITGMNEFMIGKPYLAYDRVFEKVVLTSIRVNTPIDKVTIQTTYLL